jgi:hypothetical protein
MNLSASGDLVLPQQGTCLDQPCQKPEQQEQIGQDTALASCLVFWEKLGSTSLISMDFPDGEGLGYWGVDRWFGTPTPGISFSQSAIGAANRCL